MFEEAPLLALLKRCALQWDQPCYPAVLTQAIAAANAAGESDGPAAALVLLWHQVIDDQVMGTDSARFAELLFAAALDQTDAPPDIRESISPQAIARTHTGLGLVAVVAAASPSGLDKVESERLEAYVDATETGLTAGGFDVVRPVDHDAGSALCVPERAFDLLTVIAHPRSSRTGQQVSVAKALIAPVLTIVPGGTRASCLHRADGYQMLPELDIIDAADLPQAIAARLPELLPPARDVQRRRQRFPARYGPLMSQLARALHDRDSMDLPFESAKEASVDPHTAATLSLEQWQELLAAIGLPPLQLYDPAADLTPGQRRGLDAAGPMTPDERREVVRSATRKMAAAAELEGSTQRAEQWLGKEVWDTELRVVRRGQSG